MVGLTVLATLAVALATIVILPRMNQPSEHEAIINYVSEFMVLPDEEPTVAEVTDKQALAGQDFFAAAENGDVVLFYTKSEKAILFRPSVKKVVEVAKIQIGQTSE